MEKKIIIRLLKLLYEFIDENEINLEKDVVLDENVRLIGTSSVFDSMELVQFIVDVESLLDDEFDIEIELTSENQDALEEFECTWRYQHFEASGVNF